MVGFLVRWGIAFTLLGATFNPTDMNFIAWASENYRDQTALTVLAGLLLCAGYIIYLRATLRSIGVIGIVLVGAIAAALTWVLIDQGWIDLSSQDFMIWIALFGLSFVLGVGLSWSRVRRRISGQVDVDDADQ